MLRVLLLLVLLPLAARAVVPSPAAISSATVTPRTLPLLPNYADLSSLNIANALHAADYQVQLSADAYFSPFDDYLCPKDPELEPKSCPSQRCCAVCPKNASDSCFCPENAAKLFQCMDTGDYSTVTGSGQPGEARFFTFRYPQFISSSCAPMIVTLDTISGSHFLLSVDGFSFLQSPNNSILEFLGAGMRLPLQNALMICPINSGRSKSSAVPPFDSSVLPAGHDFTALYNTNVMVITRTSGSYKLRLQEAPLQMSLGEFYYFAPPLATIRCSSAASRTEYVMPSTLAPLAPITDEASTMYSVVSGQQAASLRTLFRNDTLAFRVGGTLVFKGANRLAEVDPLSCVVNLTRMCSTKTGLPIQTPPVTFTHRSNAECNTTWLAGATAQISEASSTLDSGSITADVLTDVYLSAASVATSDRWADCLASLPGAMSTALFKSAPLKASGCTRPESDPEYAADPCCNSTLAGYMCCIPQAVPLQVLSSYEADSDAINNMCRTPVCAAQSLSDLAVAESAAQDPVQGCDALAASFFDAGLSNTQVSMCYERIGYAGGRMDCITDADCPAGIKCGVTPLIYKSFDLKTCQLPYNDEPIIECLVDLLDKSFKAELLVNPLSGYSNATLALALRNYFATTGCAQPLAAYIFPGSRNPGLDAGKSACLAQKLCNWEPYGSGDASSLFPISGFNPYRTDRECRDGGARQSTFYCANSSLTILPDLRPEVSAWGVCYSLEDKEDCTTSGGSYSDAEEWAMTQEVLPPDVKIGACVKPARTQSDCISSTYCNSSESTKCAPKCIAVAAPTQALCDCELYRNNASSPYNGPCDSKRFPQLRWNAALRLCLVDLESRYHCSKVAQTRYVPGATWLAPKLNTQATCEAAGYCSLGPATTKSECEALTYCSHPSCQGGGNIPAECRTEKGCASLSYCSSDAYLTTWLPLHTTKGACAVPPVLYTPITSYLLPPEVVRPYCKGTTDPYNFGCALTRGDPRGNQHPLTEKACAAIPGAVFLVPATNEHQCERLTRCQIKFGLVSNWETWFSKADCEACGGEVVHPFKWQTSAFKRGEWTSYQWLPRRELPLNSWSTVFNTSSLQTYIDQIFLRRMALVTSASIHCKYQTASDILNTLSCDCLNKSEGCYKDLKPRLVAAGRACRGLRSVIKSAPLVAFAESTKNTDLASGCTNVELEFVPAEAFFRPPTVYSVLLVESLAPSRNAILQNSKGVPAAALIGPGISLQVEGNFTGLLLCIAQQFSGAGYSVNDFATIDPSFDISTLRPLEIETLQQFESDVQFVCANLSQQGIYFPIRRLSHWRGSNYYATLTSSDRAALFCVLVAFLLCWLACSYRLLAYLAHRLMDPEEAKRLAASLLVPKLALGFLCLLLLLRWIYLALLPSGVAFRVGNAIGIVAAELPTTLYFSVFSLLVLYRIRLYHSKLIDVPTMRLAPLLLGVNCILYLFLFAILLVDSLKKDPAPNSLQCANQRSSSSVVSRVYKVILSVLAAALALSFIVYNSLLFRRIGVDMPHSRPQYAKFLGVTFICSLGLVADCVLLLYSAFKLPATVVSTSVAVVALVFVELLPFCVIIAVLQAPPLTNSSRSLWRKIFWPRISMSVPGVKSDDPDDIRYALFEEQETSMEI